MGKKYDIVAKVGTYTKDGEEKPVWKSVGAVVEGEKGPFIVIDRTFNPAALPDAKGDGRAYLSLFAPTEKGNAAQRAGAVAQKARVQPGGGGQTPRDGFEDDLDGIPF